MLRKGVTLLTQPPPPSAPAVAASTPDVKVESTLNALDGAIDLLSELEAGPSTKRRGRIDIVGLLMELSPSANLSFEPGAGTEVAADESELRRMLHVLVG